MGVAVVSSATFSSIGGGIARTLWEGHKISFAHPSFQKGALSGAAFPFSFFAAYLAGRYAATNGYELSQKKPLVAMVGTAVLVGANYFPRENWKLKLISNLGGLGGLLVMVFLSSIYFKDKPKGDSDLSKSL